LRKISRDFFEKKISAKFFKVNNVVYVVEKYMTVVPEEKQWKPKARDVRESMGGGDWKIRKEYMDVQRLQMEYLSER
jgi:hypothetical protein